jgi:LysM repeat protein
MSGPAASGGSKGDKEGKGIKDETIAKAVGAIVGVGIAWSLIRSFWGRKSSDVVLLLGSEHQQTDVKTEDIVEIAETKSKEVVQHKGKDILGKEKKAGPHLFEKKSDVIDVHTGDTLWGISRKYGVSVEALKAANGIGAGDFLSAGDTLVITK